MPDAIIDPAFIYGLWDTPDTLSEYDDEVVVQQKPSQPCNSTFMAVTASTLSYSSDSA